MAARWGRATTWMSAAGVEALGSVAYDLGERRAMTVVRFRFPPLPGDPPPAPGQAPGQLSGDMVTLTDGDRAEVGDALDPGARLRLDGVHLLSSPLALLLWAVGTSESGVRPGLGGEHPVRFSPPRAVAEAAPALAGNVQRSLADLGLAGGTPVPLLAVLDQDGRLTSLEARLTLPLDRVPMATLVAANSEVVDPQQVPVVLRLELDQVGVEQDLPGLTVGGAASAADLLRRAR